MMSTLITPNGSVGRIAERIERKVALTAEKESINAALKAWTPDAEFERIKTVEGLRAEIAKLRAIVLDMAKALYVSVAVDIETIEEAKKRSAVTDGRIDVKTQSEEPIRIIENGTRVR